MKTLTRIPQKTLNHLEWQRILERLAQYCRGPVAAEAALALRPAETRQKLRQKIEFNTEARALLDEGHTIPIGHPRDTRRSLTIAARQGLLEPEDLYAIGLDLDSSLRCANHLTSISEKAPRLSRLSEGLVVLPDLAQELLGSFNERGEISDSASGELGSLRQRVADLHEQLKQQVHGLLSKSDYKDKLQDDYYTIREDRYVLPVRSGHKNHVPGIVHGWSGSGATVFIEPQSVVDANNRLRLAQADVDRELHRILTRLSRMVGGQADAISKSQAILSEIDLICASAHLSRELKATAPTFSAEGRLTLVQARHPLLCFSGTAVIANDIQLDSNQRILVVTGPNTGGKTVALKTTGLCLLMAHCGLHIPASQKSVLPITPGIYSDIGDDQSLDENHSTFSGHVANLIEILKEVEPGALVLLDELAVGTDPLQGAALAQSILEELATRGAFVVVTTHYENLKTLPFEDERFRNGAMGLNTESNQPTYHLTMDVPGSSSALRTARRLGLSDAIVDRAIDLAGPEQRALQNIIEALESERSELQNLREAAQQDTDRLSALRNKLERQEERLTVRLKQGIEEERSKALEEARSFRDEIKALKRQLATETKKKDVRFLDQGRSRAEDAIARVVKAQREESAIHAGPVPEMRDLKPGQKVWVLSLGHEAELMATPDRRGRCKVRAGIMTAQVDISDLRPRNFGKKPQAKKQTNRQKSPAPSENKPSWENAGGQTPDNTVDVRGLRTDEAIHRVEGFLDRCFGLDKNIAFIIHGHGTGALKKEIRTWLRDTTYIREQRPGVRGEGGDGVTAVLLN